MKRVLLPLLLAVALLLLTPLAASADAVTATVQAPKGLNLRENPGLNEPILLGLYDGETVSILDGLSTAIYSNGVRWVEVGVWRWGYWYTGYCAFCLPESVWGLRRLPRAQGRVDGPRWPQGHRRRAQPALGPRPGVCIGRVVPYGTVLEKTAAATVAAYGYTWQQVDVGGGLWGANTWLTALP